MRLNRRLIFYLVAFCSVFFLIHSFAQFSYSKDDEFKAKLRSINPLHRGERIHSEQQQKSHFQVDEKKDSEVRREECSLEVTCELPMIYIRLHAETVNSPPFACLNDIKLFDANHVHKGLNLVALNGSNFDIEDQKSFDVSATDEKLILWLRGLPDSTVLVGVSFGDVAERISAVARRALSYFGGERVKEWRGGTAYAILGQKGLQTSAQELMLSQSSTVENDIEGCFSLPLGDIVAVNMTDDINGNLLRVDEEQLAVLNGKKDGVILGEKWEKCGMEKSCASDEIPMHFFSGEHKDDWPRMCIGERMVFDKSLNGAGRGINIAAIEPKTGRVQSVAHFDTYTDESTALELWLDAVAPGDIVAAVSFDEASTMLSEMAKSIFYELGSSMIERMKFRASWYFVGPKGISAYTPFEDLNMPVGNNWAKPIKTWICLPRTLSKWTGRRADSARGPLNLPKRHFCTKYDKHDVFCDEKNLDKQIVPKALESSEMLNDPIFSVPIVVIAGLDIDALRVTLESLMSQAGINTQMVIVAHDKEYPENEDLANLFHVKSIAMNATNSYNDLLKSAIAAAFSIFPSAPVVAMVEQEVQLSPDWLSYLAKTLPTLMEDKTVDLVQAFNPNGFSDVSGDLSLVYRSSFQPPLFSAMLSRRLYENHIKDSKDCCTAAFYGRWRLASASALVPDVSRITVATPSSIVGPAWTDSLFQKERIDSSSPTMANNMKTLSMSFAEEKSYDAELKKNVATAVVMDLNNVDCKNWKEQFAKLKSSSPGSAIVVHCGEAVAELEVASKCFGLYFDLKFVTGVYKRTIRFIFNNSTPVFIIPKGSSFYMKGANISKKAPNNSIVAAVRKT